MRVRALWTGLDAKPGVASDALRLRLLLGQRGEEKAGVQWGEVDLMRRSGRCRRRHEKQAAAVVALPADRPLVLKARRDGSQDERACFQSSTLTGDGAHRR